MTTANKDFDQAKLKANTIKLMIFDVDGVLTDGSLIYSSNGEEIKIFNVLDGYGIKQLVQHGVKTAVISGRSSKALDCRIRDLDINYVYTDVGDDKTKAFNNLLQKTKLSSNHYGMMGDDITDLAIIEKCGFSAAPINAIQQVLNQVDWISRKSGGRGAVREVCDLIISN